MSSVWAPGVWSPSIWATGVWFDDGGAVAPGAPTIGVAVPGNGFAQVSFTAPGSNGGSPITGYLATSTPGGITGFLAGAGSGSIVVSGLTNGTSYTFTVHAINAIGNSVESAASNAVTPVDSIVVIPPDPAEAIIYTSARRMIEDALEESNSLGVDQTITAKELADCVRRMNRIIDAWRIIHLAIYAQKSHIFQTTAGKATYTIGAGADWEVTRPPYIDDPIYYSRQSISYPVRAMSKAKYDATPDKTRQGMPISYHYNNLYPHGEVTLWPVPDFAAAITLSFGVPLVKIVNPDTPITFPPGYESALHYAMATAFLPMYGKKRRDYPDIVAMASSTLADVKRSNWTPTVAEFDRALLSL
jgi:hypothetical protein